MTTALLAAVLTAAATWLAGPLGRRGRSVRPGRSVDPGRSVGPGRRGAARSAVPGGSAATGPSVTSRDVTTSLVLLALAYRSGLPTTSVLAAVADGVSEATARDLRQVGAALQWGAAETEAWASVDVAWRPAARALQVAHAAGLPPGALLLRASDDLQQAEVERLEVSAARAGVRLVLPLGLVLLPAFALTAVVPLIVALGQQLLAGR